MEERDRDQHARILVVEDNETNRGLMVYLLRAFGYQPDSAIDGPSGFESVLSRPPDLILCDVHMPKVDGFDFVKLLKLDEKLRNIPVVAVTALAMLGDRERILAAGFDAYISKPIDPERFIPEIEKFLPERLHSKSRQDRSLTGNSLPQPASDSDIVDLVQFHKASCNNAERAKQLVDVYLSEGERLLGSLKSAVDSNSPDEIKMLAHSLAGSSLTCGVLPIIPPLRRLEELGETKKLLGAVDAWEDAKVAFEQSRKFFRSDRWIAR